MKMISMRMTVLFSLLLIAVAACAAPAGYTRIAVTNEAVLNGLSPYNWVCREQFIGSSICGASLAVKFRDTQQVALEVNSDHITTTVPDRFPILAWSVNGGPVQTHQLLPDDRSIDLCSGVQDPSIDLYIRGLSPFENRYAGDTPVNSVKITEFVVDEGGAAIPAEKPEKIWLNIGDSILSGDAAAYAEGQGRPPNDLWAASDDGRAGYGYLLAEHYGFHEARLAYGGYKWNKGMAGLPGLDTLIDKKTSTISRLQNGSLSPAPDVVLINLGENGVPSEYAVNQGLSKVRSRAGAAAKLIVMIPLSGKGRAQITAAFESYKANAADENAYLVDLGPIEFATADGVHPTAAGHQSVFEAALPVFDQLIKAKGTAEK